MPVKPPALPEQATIAVVAPPARRRRARRSSRPPPTSRLAGTRWSSGPTTARCTATWPAPTTSAPPTCSGRSASPASTWCTRCAAATAPRGSTTGSTGARLGDPRIVCGYSDITALHLALAAHAGWVSFYGPNFLRFTRRKGVELTEETEAWFHRAFEPEPLGRVFEDPEDPYVLTVGEGVAEAPLVGGCLTLLTREHRDAVRGADRRLHRDGRGPQHRPVPGRHGAQPPGPRRQARQRRRLRVRDRRELAGSDHARGSRSRRSRSRRSSTS